MLRVHDEDKLARFTPHPHLLNSATAVAQTERVPAPHEAGNKLFMALCRSPSCGGVLDHPDRAHGDNPEVLAVSAGVRRGLAGKVLNGTPPLTSSERLQEGVSQTEVSPAEVGFVLLSFRNVLDRRRAWPPTNLRQQTLTVALATSASQQT